MPGFVHVKQAETGHRGLVPLEHFENAPKGAYERLDDVEYASADNIPWQFKTTVAEQATAKQETASGAAANATKENS